MKTQRFFKNEAQRKADDRDEKKADAFIISIIIAILISLFISLIQ